MKNSMILMNCQYIMYMVLFLVERVLIEKLLWSFQKKRTIRFILSHIIGLILFN